VNDVNSHATGGKLVLANVTLTKAASAIMAGMGAEHSIDFFSTFGHLTDTYVHH
jgi:hypothetical protein